MNGMFIASKLIPDAAAIWLQRWPAISGALFLYLSGQKAQSGIINSIISDALASFAFKSGTVSGTASPFESDKVISTGEEESRTNNIPNLIDDDMHQTSSYKNMTPVSEPINIASIGYDANQTGDYAAKDVTGQVTLLSAFDNHETQSSDDRTGEETVPDESVLTAELLSVLDQMSGSGAADVEAKVETTSSEEPSLVGMESGTPGEKFLDWLKSSILDGTVSVNEGESFAHILAQFVFIVSPACFFKYLSLNTNESLDKSELQKSFEALNVHYSRNGKGLWHYHKYDTPDKSGRYTKMSGYMLSADIIYRKGTCPPDSVWLARRN